MKDVAFPPGLRLERLRREHPRRRFRCGRQAVDHWLATKALQHQEKHLSATKVLVDEQGAIAGYYTLATGQVDFGDLPVEIGRKLPRRQLPVAVLAWLGVDTSHQGEGLGKLLLAQSLRDCWEAGKTFAFVAVVLDCLDEAAKTFYEQWDFRQLPGHPYRLFVGAKLLDAMMKNE
ncbi:MAG TPA: GNAT family N-acetyltransferase [Thermoguttaceae bacterium]|nr:GNAT family N-acetyltransferase [Thermoguttaceae bacterium]